MRFTSLEYNIILYTANVAISKNAQLPCATVPCANSGIDGGKKDNAWAEDHKLQTDLQHDFMIESNSIVNYCSRRNHSSHQSSSCTYVKQTS